MRAREATLRCEGARSTECQRQRQRSSQKTEIVLPLHEASSGMRLRDEIRTTVGALLVPVGFEISERLLDRISQVAPEVLDQKVRLVTPARPSAR